MTNEEMTHLAAAYFSKRGYSVINMSQATYLCRDVETQGFSSLCFLLRGGSSIFISIARSPHSKPVGNPRERQAQVKKAQTAAAKLGFEHHEVYGEYLHAVIEAIEVILCSRTTGGIGDLSYDHTAREGCF